MMTWTATDRREVRAKKAVELRVLTDQALTAIGDVLDLLDDLTDTHQRGLPFASVAAKRMMDDQARKERGDRVRLAKAGLSIPGASAAPVNVAAVSIAAEIPMALLDLNRRLRKAIVGPRPASSGTEAGKAIADTRRLLPLVAEHSALLDAAHTTESLAERARNVALGHDRTELGRPCPHCNRMTLVVYLEQGVIRCERDPGTSEYEACICDDSYCQCKVRHHRHEWLRSARSSHKWSWRSLARDQNRAEQARAEAAAATSQRAPEEKP